jgi:hypothetical protein
VRFLEKKQEKKCCDDEDGAESHLQTQTIEPLEDPCQVRGKEGIPIREAKKDGDGPEIRIDSSLSLLHGSRKPLTPSLVQPILHVGLGE